MDDYVVGLDEYKELNENNPIGYTRDLATCIAVLLHLKGSSILMHIAAFESGKIELDKFIRLVIEKRNEIEKAEIFKAPKTVHSSLDKVCDVLINSGISFEIEDVFINYSNMTSVGYNYNTKTYYMVDMNLGEPEFTEVPKGYKIEL